MSERIYLVVHGQPYQRATQVRLLKNGLLRSAYRMDALIRGTKQLGSGKTLVALDRARFQGRQRQQGIESRALHPEKPKEPLRLDSLPVLLTLKTRESSGDGSTDHLEASPRRLAEEEAYREALSDVESALRGKGIPFEKRYFGDLGQVDPKKFTLALSLGGDQTFLQTAHFAGRHIPVLGVKGPGSHAALTGITPQELEKALELMRSGRYQIWSHVALQAALRYQRKFLQKIVALNEISIRPTDRQKTVKWHVAWEGIESDEIFADDLYIGTGTGSTGWLETVGGVPYDVDVPLLQMVGFNAPDPRSADDKTYGHILGHSFQIESTTFESATIGVDGTTIRHPFQHGTTLKIETRPRHVRSLRFPEIAERRSTSTPSSSPRIPEIASPLPTYPSPDLERALEWASFTRELPQEARRSFAVFDIGKNVEYLVILGGTKNGDGTQIWGEPIAIGNPPLVFPIEDIARLEDATERHLAFKMYSYPYQLHRHRGTIVEWNAQLDTGVQPPKISTIWLHEALHSEKLLDSRVNTAAVLFVGNGLIPRSIVENCPYLQTLWLQDPQKAAIRTTKRNLDPVLRKAQKVRVASASRELQGIPKVDLLVVDAPSIPVPEGRMRRGFEGVEPLRRIIQDAPSHLTRKGVLVLKYSSLAQRQVDRWLKKQSAFSRREIQRTEVPLITSEILHDPEWKAFLIQLGLLPREESFAGYHYWHTLIVEALTLA